MTTIAIITGLGASILLLTAGYLFGLRRGLKARDLLRRQIQQLAGVVTQLRESSRRDVDQDGSLRTTIQQVLAPLVERERISLELAQFSASAGQRRDLAPLLDRIAAVGSFKTVLLSNEEGLPLASNRGARNPERLAAIATRLAVVSDQCAGEDALAPLSILLRDASETMTLCRIFRVRGQRLFFVAVSTNPRLSSVALDPALAKIEAALSTPVGDQS